MDKCIGQNKKRFCYTIHVMKETIGVIAVLLSIIGHLPYIADILKGKTKPHIFTWIVWAVVTLIAFFGQWQKGGGAGSWTTAVTGVITILIAILALRNGSKEITKSDTLAFSVALLSIIPWYFTKDPTFSIIIITLIDVFAFFPTVRKTLNDPDSETLITYALNFLRHGLSVLALANYNIATTLYPFTLLLMNLVMTAIILKGKTAVKVAHEHH
jgi:chromate transport protein ChrA